jgi:adenine-specific DNA-methyltransferase
MDKLDLTSMDVTEFNIEKIAKAFPEAITEEQDDKGNIVKRVKFDVLKMLLGSEDENPLKERYDFTWPGKRNAIKIAAEHTDNVLRPCPEESENWDTTQNLYIEGDNLEVLKILQKSYLGKVKLIYIDPPYNTGNDFIYRDSYKQSTDEYKLQTGAIDEEGNRLVPNPETNGQFHSDWCSMIYPRLVLAKNLLTDDGVIFISIDDHEQANLKKMCDEIFGEQNFVAQFVWERAFSPKNDARYVSNSHDYVLMYARTLDRFVIGRLPRTEEANARYANPDNDSRGLWMSADISVKTYNEACDYPITTPSGRVIEPPAGRCWRLSQKGFQERLKDNRIWFGPDGNGVPRLKRFLSELKNEGMAPTSILRYRDVGHSQEGAQEVSKLLDGGYFDGPKPVRLMRRLITLANTQKDSLVLDFFSGSGSMAHAVMQQNCEDGGSRKFIMVQLPEICDEKSEAYKAGYKTICDIGKERIRRAGKAFKKQVEEDNAKIGLFDEDKKVVPDFGFRDFKLDSSNRKDVAFGANEITQGNLFAGITKEDRSELDLLFGVMEDWGLALSLPYEKKEINGIIVHIVDKKALVACFAKDLPETVMIEIAKMGPERVVFRDECFKDSVARINAEQFFKHYDPAYRPETMKVL